MFLRDGCVLTSIHPPHPHIVQAAALEKTNLPDTNTPSIQAKLHRCLLFVARIPFPENQQPQPCWRQLFPKSLCL
jgi:hypothetical protein